MANFPTSLDTLSNPAEGTSMEDPAFYHDVVHATTNDILEALEAKVGIDSSAVATSLDSRVAVLEALVAAIAGGVEYVAGTTPVGVVTASRPRLCYGIDGSLWAHTSATADNTSWVPIFQP